MILVIGDREAAPSDTGGGYAHTWAELGWTALVGVVGGFALVAGLTVAVVLLNTIT